MFSGLPSINMDTRNLSNVRVRVYSLKKASEVFLFQNRRSAYFTPSSIFRRVESLRVDWDHNQKVGEASGSEYAKGTMWVRCKTKRLKNGLGYVNVSDRHLKTLALFNFFIKKNILVILWDFYLSGRSRWITAYQIQKISSWFLN